MVCHEAYKTIPGAKDQADEDKEVEIQTTMVADNYSPAACRQPFRELDLSTVIEPPGIQETQ